MRRMPSPGLQWGAAESRRRSWKPPRARRQRHARSVLEPRWTEHRSTTDVGGPGLRVRAS